MTKFFAASLILCLSSTPAFGAEEPVDCSTLEGDAKVLCAAKEGLAKIDCNDLPDVTDDYLAAVKASQTSAKPLDAKKACERGMAIACESLMSAKEKKALAKKRCEAGKAALRTMIGAD